MHASERTQHEDKIKPDVFNVYRVLNGAATQQPQNYCNGIQKIRINVLFLIKEPQSKVKMSQISQIKIVSNSRRLELPVVLEVNFQENRRK